MKTKIFSRLLCFSLSATMLLGISSVNKNEVTAAGTYDCTLTITAPIPGEVPKQPVLSGSSMKYEILGYLWDDSSNIYDNCGTYIPDTEFMDWYTDTAESLGDDFGNAFETFDDGHEYNLSVMAKISNYSLPAGTEGEVTFIDSVSSEELGTGICSYVSVSDLVTQMPEGISLPSCLTKNDTLVLIGDIPSMICAPEGHEHTKGEYCFDDEYHWRVCSECEIDLAYTKSSHYVSHSATEPWTVTKSPTATETGLWEKKCSAGCGYDYDSVVVPCLNDQTIVSSYEELRDALAKGGKQWITINVSGVTKWISQEDMIYDNGLIVNDPNADITIDMNGCGISRETGRLDDALFEVKAGKLRILSRSLKAYPNDSSNLHFTSLSADCTLFKVHENGSLRVTNVTGLYNVRPSIISEGNLQIDGGDYNCSVNEFDTNSSHPVSCILIKGGNAIISGGKFDSEGTAIGVLGGNLTITSGFFGGWDNAVYFNNDATTVNIYGGQFDKSNTTQGWYQDYGILALRGTLNIFYGSFYGDNNAVFVSGNVKAVNIYDGYFKQYGTGAVTGSAAFRSLSKNTKIYQGTFVGPKGIVCGSGEFALEDYLFIGRAGVTVTDDDMPVDISTKADFFGESYLKIYSDSDYPIITKEPESVDAFSGDEVVFKVEAKNATRYEWYIFDADDETEQPYSWEDLKKYYDVSGENTDTLVIHNVKGWFDNKGVCCTVYSDSDWNYSKNAYLTVHVKGDVNNDGVFGVSDVVKMQKWLLCVGELTNWENGDLCEDNVIDAFDLCLMRKMLIEQ